MRKTPTMTKAFGMRNVTKAVRSEVCICQTNVQKNRQTTKDDGICNLQRGECWVNILMLTSPKRKKWIDVKELQHADDWQGLEKPVAIYRSSGTFCYSLKDVSALKPTAFANNGNMQPLHELDHIQTVTRSTNNNPLCNNGLLRLTSQSTHTNGSKHFPMNKRTSSNWWNHLLCVHERRRSCLVEPKYTAMAKTKEVRKRQPRNLRDIHSIVKDKKKHRASSGVTWCPLSLVSAVTWTKTKTDQTMPKNNPRQPRHQGVSKAIQASGTDFFTTWLIDYFILFAFLLNSKDPGIMNHSSRVPNIILGKRSSLHSASDLIISNCYTIKATPVNKAATRSTNYL